MTGLPNVRARIHWRRTVPGAPDTEYDTVLWLSGERFRVRDEHGRPYAEILGDVTEPRGFGLLPRTMEAFMDAWALAAKPAEAPTGLYGDLSTGDGRVYEPGTEPWPVPAERIALLATYLLHGDEPGGDATPTGHAVHLGRECVEYTSHLTGAEYDGRAFHSTVRTLVAGAYVLSREVRDAEPSGLSLRSDVIELDEGVVADADVRAPA